VSGIEELLDCLHTQMDLDVETEQEVLAEIRDHLEEAVLEARGEGLDEGEALARADSMIAVFLTERVPEVSWILPDELRAVARRAPGMLVNPDQMGTALLRNPIDVVPDPLRSQMRNLNAVSGVRFALVPAGLLFFRELDGGGRAELTVVIVEVRRGQVQWRTVARGVGGGPWEGTWNALRTLVPGLP